MANTRTWCMLSSCLILQLHRVTEQCGHEYGAGAGAGAGSVDSFAL